MKKSLVLILILLLLGIFAFYLNSKGDTTPNGYDFAIKNPDDVWKVELIHPSSTVVLERVNKNTWSIDGQVVRDEAIHVLLETFRKLHIKERVPLAAEKTVIKRLEKDGIKARAYNKSGELIKSLIVGGASPGKKGTYMMVEGAANPFNIDILNWDGVLRTRFMLNKEDWRDRSVFRYKAEEIKSVSTKFYNKIHEQSSFKIEHEKGDQYKITRLAGVPVEKKPIKGKVLYYMKSFEKVGAEAFETKNRLRDSIVQTIPFCEIEVTPKSGPVRNVKFYPIAADSASINKNGSPDRSDVERYFASVDNNKDFMLVQHRVFQRLFAPYRFFFEEEKKSKKK